MSCLLRVLYTVTVSNLFLIIIMVLWSSQAVYRMSIWVCVMVKYGFWFLRERSKKKCHCNCIKTKVFFSHVFINHDHLTEVEFVKFLQGTLYFSPFSTLYSLERSHYVQPTPKRVTNYASLSLSLYMYLYKLH